MVAGSNPVSSTKSKQFRGGFGVVRDRLSHTRGDICSNPHKLCPHYQPAGRWVAGTGHPFHRQVARTRAPMAATTQRVGVSPRASEIWDRAEAMLEVPGTHR